MHNNFLIPNKDQSYFKYIVYIPFFSSWGFLRAGGMRPQAIKIYFNLAFSQRSVQKYCHTGSAGKDKELQRMEKDNTNTSEDTICFLYMSAWLSVDDPDKASKLLLDSFSMLFRTGFDNLSGRVVGQQIITNKFASLSHVKQKHCNT